MLYGRQARGRNNCRMAKTPRPSVAHLGHCVREWRKVRGETLESLAGKAGVTHGAISQLERGDTNYTQGMLEALASALNCRPSQLLEPPPIDAQLASRLNAAPDALEGVLSASLTTLVGSGEQLPEWPKMIAGSIRAWLGHGNTAQTKRGTQPRKAPAGNREGSRPRESNAPKS